MRLLDELTDRWGLLVSAVFGGLGWAVIGATSVSDSTAVLAGIGIGLGALGVKVVAGALSASDKADDVDDQQILRGSPEEAWLQRAVLATKSLREVAAGARPGPLADQLAGVVTEASSTLGDMRRVAGQASAVTSAMWRVDAPQLRREEARLVESRESAVVSDVRHEVDRSLLSVRGQLAVHKRLYDAAASLLAKMQSGTHGLETLVASVAELVAVSDASPGNVDTAEQMEELASELDSLRLGLAETEELSRRVLDAEPTADATPVFRKDDSSTRDSGRAGPLQEGN